MKRFCLLLALFLVLTAGSVFAHEKGDLVLNIEPQNGLAFPNFNLFLTREWMLGPDFGLRATADYYLTDSFAVNAGLGYGFNYHFFFTGGPTADPVTAAKASILIVGIGLFPPFWGLIPAWFNHLKGDDIVKTGEYFASYITIPFGIRCAPQPFTAGAGLTANIPVFGFGEYPLKEYERAEETIPVTFKLRPYLGWYLDIGFDKPNKKKARHSFGMLFRLGGQFIKEIAEPSSPKFNYENTGEITLPYRFNFVSASIVLKFGIGLGNFPIGGKKDNGVKHAVGVNRFF
jgi:hypothetical protein